MGSDTATEPYSNSQKRFQSTLPRGERPGKEDSNRSYEKFQSTLPRGERRRQIINEYLTCVDFNPRSRVGSDLCGGGYIHCRRDFNPRSRVGSDGYASIPVSDCHNFNPRSRVGSDYIQLFKYGFVSDFNPRSRVGSDKIGSCGRRHSWRFQSTLPRGERLVAEYDIRNGTEISIHAPAWGATKKGAAEPQKVKNFNPRSRVGSDQNAHGNVSGKMYFNPRSRVGSDKAGCNISSRDIISIHAPAWGATDST